MPYNEILGECFNKADGRLRKQLEFKYMKKSGRDLCHVCDKPITKIDDMTYDHVIPWQSEPLEASDLRLFTDKNNVKFAHSFCNNRRIENKLGENVLGVHEEKPGVYTASITASKGAYTIGRYRSVLEGQIAYDLAGYYTREGCGRLNFPQYEEVYKKYLQGISLPIDDFLSIRRGPLKKITTNIIEELGLKA